MIIFSDKNPVLQNNNPAISTEQSEKDKRQSMFENMIVKDKVVSGSGTIIIDNIPSQIRKVVDRMFQYQSIYEAISHTFPNPIRWYHIALIHQMEAEGDFTKYLGNGQSLNQVTTKVPKGRGAFKDFYSGAIDAIKYDGLDKIQDWSEGAVLWMFEKWNGLGYNDYHPDVNTPYNWSGTNFYTKGKYTEVKNIFGQYVVKYDPNLISNQIGVAPFLKEIISRGVN